MNVGFVPLLFVAVVVSLSLVGLARSRSSATAIDFQLAGRGVGVRTNALAICGDYVSAASFLGVAAAVYAVGLDGAWYATGFAAGFVPVALFAAAPLRRLGERSIPDFLARRYRSEPVRLVAVIVTELVILAYLVPQAVGAGVAFGLVSDWSLPGISTYDTGVVLSTVFVTVIVVVGGMRGTTWNQAFQFLVMVGVLLWLAIAVLRAGFSYSDAVGELARRPLTVVPADGGDSATVLTDQLDGGPARFDQPGGRYDALAQFSLVVTLVFGTVGLPHVMNRFFTSPTGRAARMTAVWVVAAVGVFYALAVMLGTAARVYVFERVGSDPWLSAETIDGVLVVPEHALLALGELFGGDAGLAVVATGAVIAIMSTVAGLVLAASASWGYDVYERYINPTAPRQRALRVGQLAVVVVATLAGLIAVLLDPSRVAGNVPSVIAGLVTAAFSIAGSSLGPVILLGIWWRGATALGAIAAMTVGALSAGVLVTIGLFVADAPTVLASPTIITGPLAVTTLVAVSKLTAPTEALDVIWVRMHGTATERRLAVLAQLSASQTTR